MRLIALAALVLLAPQDRNRPEPDVKNAKYGDHARHVLDLWKAKSDKPTPLVVFIHGGGFRGGSKEQVSPQLIEGCLKEGISVASINYRLTDTAPFPAAMRDGARAVQFLRARAKEYHLDPARFAATGGSAGAGISLWLAFHDDLADPRSDDPVARESTRLSCVLAVNGQTSYDPRFIQEHIGGRAHEHPALPPFWGLKPEEFDTEKAHNIYEECSPITFLTKDDPPVLLTYAGNDKPSDKAGAGIHHENFGFVLQKKMKELGLECDVRVGAGGARRGGDIEFFVKHLKKG